MEHSSPVAPDDAEAIRAVVARFVHQALEPAVERPELRLAAPRLQALTDQLSELGLINLEPEAGLGLWDAPDDRGSLRLTLRCLQMLAAANAGVALHVHQLAHAAWFARSLGADCATPAAVSLLGGYGMGRALLPRVLRGVELSADEARWLQGYFEPTDNCPLVCQLGAGVRALWVTRFDAASQHLRFEQHSLEPLGGQVHDASHGLDETFSLLVSQLPQREAAPAAADDPRGVALYRRALELHGLGLCAIATGAQQHAHEKAREYAELRVQAGVRIVQHPAVQELLGQSRSALASGRCALDGLVEHALSSESLAASLAARAELHETLSVGTNAALQVFGGIGYMRDTGLEKLVRDQNHLRLSCGTPAQLRRFAVELERTP